MTDRHAAIREALAAGPTPGPWAYAHNSWSDSSVLDKARTIIASLSVGEDGEEVDAALMRVDAAYIAACSPDAIAALLADLDAARREAAAEKDRSARMWESRDDERARADSNEQDAKRYRAMKEYDARRFQDDLDFDAQADSLITELASGKFIDPLGEKRSILADIEAKMARAAELEAALRRVIGVHIAPDYCYSTGPQHGDARDATCPSCEGLRLLAEGK